MGVMWAIGCISLAIWIVLLAGRGGFWLPRPQLRLAQQPIEQQSISVVAVIPARNEEDILGKTLPSVLGQDFSGDFQVILVDDRLRGQTLYRALSK